MAPLPTREHAPPRTPPRQAAPPRCAESEAHLWAARDASLTADAGVRSRSRTNEWSAWGRVLEEHERALDAIWTHGDVFLDCLAEWQRASQRASHSHSHSHDALVVSSDGAVDGNPKVLLRFDRRVAERRHEEARARQLAALEREIKATATLPLRAPLLPARRANAGVGVRSPEGTALPVAERAVLGLEPSPPAAVGPATTSSSSTSAASGTHAAGSARGPGGFVTLPPRRYVNVRVGAAAAAARRFEEEARAAAEARAVREAQWLERRFGPMLRWRCGG
jgi:hypothetical protein